MLPTNTPLERQSHEPVSTSELASKNYRRSVDWRDSGIFIDTESDCSSKRSSLDVIESPLQSAYDLMILKEQEVALSSRRSIESIYSTLSIGSHTQEEFKSSEKLQQISHPYLDCIKFQDDDGDTLLHLAVVGCSYQVIKDLVQLYHQENLFDVTNNMMHTALHVAVMTHRTDIVKLLIKSGAKHNLRDRRGNTCLHVACQHGDLETISAILLSITYVEEQNSKTLVRDGCHSIRSLLEMTNFDGQTCLHLAAAAEDRHILKLLINDYNTNINLRDAKSGDTILHKAIKQYDVDLASFILKSLKGHCNSPNYAGHDPLKTIEIMEMSVDSQSLTPLRQIRSLILERIESCSLQGKGCCKGVPDRHSGSAEESDYFETSDDEECGSP